MYIVYASGRASLCRMPVPHGWDLHARAARGQLASGCALSRRGHDSSLAGDVHARVELDVGEVGVTDGYQPGAGVRHARGCRSVPFHRPDSQGRDSEERLLSMDMQR